MDKEKDTKTKKNPFLVRFKPDYRYTDKKTFEYKLNTDTGGFTSHDECVTDKEAFAINFASERGDMSSLGASREFCRKLLLYRGDIVFLKTFVEKVV